MNHIKFDHAKFTALCVLLNSDTGMSVQEYDDYTAILYNARNKLAWLSERHGCITCKFFTNEHGLPRGCQKADGKLPPDHIQKSGCEVFENKHEIPF